jgi:hypothetical protein
MKKLNLVLIGFGILGFSIAPNVMAAGGRHPHLNAAKMHCEQALNQLRQAYNGPEQFGGDRARAEQGIQQAIEEINKAIQFANEHPGK